VSIRLSRSSNRESRSDHNKPIIELVKSVRAAGIPLSHDEIDRKMEETGVVFHPSVTEVIHDIMYKIGRK
jgi:hypothetical protein